MKRKIFSGIFFTSLFCILAAVFLVIFVFYSDFYREMKQKTVEEAYFLKASVEESGADILTQLSRTGSHAGRVTLISQTGEVLFDSYTEAQSLENHLSRPEVQAALQKGEGEETRLSDTLQENTYYYAVRLSDGSVLRVSDTTHSVFALILQAAPYILLTVLLMILCAALTARFYTKKVVRPINEINLEAPDPESVYEELSPLIVRIKRQHEEIGRKMEELDAKRKEFETITDNMREGLVLFSAAGTVLSANRSACTVFGVTQDAVLGGGFLTLCRNLAYMEAVEAALRGESREAVLSLNGRSYRLAFSTVPENGGQNAVILLMHDVTDRTAAERMRREFSANVSHELKTPLTTIMGYAELIANGIAKEGDISDFAAKIQKEAKRLLTLIEDIINLSHLDEGEVALQKESVDLVPLCKTVLAELAPKASQKNVRTELSVFPGEKTEIEGFAPILHEMIYNLCDNAIVYNVQGGSVSVRIAAEDGGVAVTVSDTGIGIAEKYQTRIFERFFRVDKSRSRETGGTGLGLSIVKHGAELHGARITLHSRPGEGTQITVLFPPAETGHL